MRGPGWFAFCPCPEPPITVGFTGARIALPGDLILENPTLRAGGVPVAWLPLLWLRSPRRVGLLPLKVAYRGDDGLLLGSGVHVPLGEADQVDVRAAGYVKGGVDLETRLSTRRSESFVRWDYFDGSLLALDLRGSVAPVPGGSLAWSADALRGERALAGPVLLEEAALRQDRVRVATGVSDGRATIAFTALADAPRGGAIQSLGAAGPGLHAGFGSALGTIGAAEVDVEVATLHVPNAGSTTIVVHHGEVRMDARGGALLVAVQARSRAALTVNENESGTTGAAGVSGELSAPFVKRFGRADAPFEHWITPFAGGTVGVARSEMPSVFPALAPDGMFAIVASGVRTTVGEIAGRRSALTMALKGGALVEGRDASTGFVAARGVADERPFSFHEESVVVPRSYASVHVLEARIGTLQGLFVSARMHESFGVVPVLARFAFSGQDGGWDAPWVEWFERTGASVGGRVGVPWTSWLTTRTDVVYDATARELLGVRGSLAYLHPCGCLRVSLWGGERVGRHGPDAFLTVDLAP